MKLEELARTERDHIIFALSNSLYLKVEEYYADIEICTNNSDKQSYWELKQLQERISALFTEQGKYYEPISASAFLGKNKPVDKQYINLLNDHPIPIGKDGADALEVKLCSQDTYKLITRGRRIMLGVISGIMTAACAGGVAIAAVRGNAHLGLYSGIGAFLGVFGVGFSAVDILYGLNEFIPISTTRYIKQLRKLNKKIEREQEIISRPEKYNRNKIIASEKNKDKLLAKKNKVAEKLDNVRSALNIRYRWCNNAEKEIFWEKIIAPAEISKEAPVEQKTEAPWYRRAASRTYEELKQFAVAAFGAFGRPKVVPAIDLLAKHDENVRKRSELEKRIISMPIEIRKKKLSEPEGLERIGKRINGKYEVIEYLGGGLNGDVYKAKLIGTNDEFVAIKFADENTINLLHKLRHLDDSSVIKVQDWNLDEKFVVFPYKPCNLRDVINELKKSNKLLPADVAEGLIHKIISAIACAHEKGILHRDIKPENILLDERGNVAVSDFGLAKEVQPDDLSSLRSVKGFEGTVAYRAPEQEENPSLSTEKTDAYQIGLIFNELLLNTRHPQPISIWELRPDIDASTAILFENLLLAEDSRMDVKTAREEFAGEFLLREKIQARRNTEPKKHLELKIIEENPAEQETVSKSLHEPKPATLAPLVTPTAPEENLAGTTRAIEPVPAAPASEPTLAVIQQTPETKEQAQTQETYQAPVPDDTDEEDDEDSEEDERKVMYEQ